jgi:hypothetical protein
MFSHSTSKIVLAGATMLIGVVPALAHGGGSVSHSSSSSVGRSAASTRSVGPSSTRVSPVARSIASPAPAGRMLVTTAPSVSAKTTTAPTISALADTPAADPPAPGAAVVTTSLSTMSGGGGGGGSPSDLSQFNPGAQDLATPAVSAPRTTDITTTTTTTGSQILGVNGLVLPNATTSGDVAQAPISGAIPASLTALASVTAVLTTPGEVIATSGGSAITGASGGDMPTCMAAWDTATHITKPRWREICARTLIEPHI